MLGQITQFDNDMAVKFKTDIEADLQRISDKYGINVKVDKISLDSRKKMTMRLIAAVGEEVSLSDTDGGKLFLSYCERYGIESDALGKTIWLKNVQYRLVGWVPSAPKYCVEAERVRDGKVFRITTHTVKSLLE